MPFKRRSEHLSFIENQQQIESDWDIKFGDRKNEIVFIGQDMDEEILRSLLDACLATTEEINSSKWEKGYQDDWPVQRAYALE